MTHDQKLDAMEMGKGALVGGTSYLITLSDVVAIVTIVYIVMQAGLLVPKYWKMYRDWKNAP